MADFITQENADMLWEIIAENDVFPKTEQTSTLFVQLLPKFYNDNKGNTSLLSLNKQFIQTMLTTISLKTKQPPIESAMMTHEQIQEHRKTEFEKEMSRKQTEFTRAMALPVPDPPKFSDATQDEPLGDMSDIIKRMIAERNLDITSIQKTHNPVEAETWLKPRDASLATEQATQKENAIKYIKIDKDALNVEVPAIDLNASSLKQVSWGATTNIAEASNPASGSNFDLFSKLKRSHLEEDAVGDNGALNIRETADSSKAQYATKEDVRQIREYIEERFNALEQLLLDRMEYSPASEPEGFQDTDA